MKAHDFSLRDENGEMHSLSDYRGKWVVMYFYPKDDTPGCTTEACGFRDSLDELKKQGAVILGVSKDSIASHRKFKDKYHLNFTLLSDTDTSTIKAYGAWGKKKFLGKEFKGTLRITYLIDPKGKIVKKYDKVDPAEHAKQILREMYLYNFSISSYE